MNQPISTPTTLNGLIPAAMEAMAAQIAAAPESARVAFPVTSSWQGATRIRCQVPGFELGDQTIERPYTIAIDEPSELLGSDTAANPQQLLLAALAACLSITFVDHATMHGIQVHQLEADIRGELDLRGVMGLDGDVPPGFPALTCRLHIKADASTEQLNDILAAACALSPTYWQLSRSTPIHTELVVIAA